MDTDTRIKEFSSLFGDKRITTWEKYQKGELGDDIDIMEWMGLYENCLLFVKHNLTNER